MVNKYQRAVDMLNGHLKNKIVQSNDGDYGEFINDKINGTLAITEYENDEVKKVDTGVFSALESLTSVSFPACISIEDYAFEECASLASMSFPVCKSIGEGAFEICESLASVDFPACTYIGEYAFYECSSLESANFPVCTTIADGVFYGCPSLTSVNFPVCEIIGEEAFEQCSSLTSLYFTGSSVPSIASDSFSGIPSTATFYVASSMVDAFKSASYWSAFASRIVAYEEE